MFLNKKPVSQKPKQKSSFVKILLWLGIVFFSVILIIAIGILSLEIFGPEDKRLSSYLNENYPKPLVADSNYDVIVLKECDLSIKYNKKYSVEEIKISDDISQITTQNSVTARGISIKNDSGIVNISCMNSPQESSKNSSTGSSEGSLDVSKLTFFTKPSINYLEKNKAIVNTFSAAFVSIGNRTYVIAPSPGAKDLDFGLQIDSLAPSKASVTNLKVSTEYTSSQNLIMPTNSDKTNSDKINILTDPTYQKTTSTAPFIADNEYDIVVMNGADLAIKYNKKYKVLINDKFNSRLQLGSKDRTDVKIDIYQQADPTYDNFCESEVGAKLVKPFDSKKIPFLSTESKEKLDVSCSLSNFISDKYTLIQIYFKKKNEKSYNLLRIQFENDYKNDFEIQFDSLAPSKPSVI